jgi:hypothetical protein
MAIYKMSLSPIAFEAEFAASRLCKQFAAMGVNVEV